MMRKAIIHPPAPLSSSAGFAIPAFNGRPRTWPFVYGRAFKTSIRCGRPRMARRREVPKVLRRSDKETHLENGATPKNGEFAQKRGSDQCRAMENGELRE